MSNKLNPQTFINLATTLCTNMGRASTVTFTRAVDASYSTSTLEPTETTATTYTVVGAVVPNKPFNIGEIPDYNNIVNKKLMYVPGVDVSGHTIQPKVNDTVVLDTTYRVLFVTSYETQSVNCAYFLMLGV